jgi:ATP-dependent DNA helicase RecG
VGLPFFNDAPHRFFPATQIDVVYFPEGAGGDRFEEKVFQGPLGRITRDAIDYVARSSALAQIEDVLGDLEQRVSS